MFAACERKAGFYFYEDSIHLYGVSEYWNLDDELGCHFASAELKLDWPNKEPIISDRDKALLDYKELENIFSFS